MTSTKPMEEGNDSLVDLFRVVEEALAIAGAKTMSELSLSLDTAELELGLTTKKSVEGGVEVKAIGINASVKAESESKHTYKLKLRRSAKPQRTLGAPSALELAETIFALAKATESVASRSTDFAVDEATVIVDVSQTKEGALKIGAGPVGGSGNLCKITLIFTSRPI